MTPEQIEWAEIREHQREREQRRNQLQSPEEWTHYWELRLDKWRKLAQAGDAEIDYSIREELQANKSGQALDALYGALLDRTKRSKSKGEEEAFRKVAVRIVAAFGETSEAWSTGALVHFALDHPAAEVRAAAGDALKGRPPESFVPLLLRRVQSPIEVGTTVVAYPYGSVSSRVTLYREGEKADRSEVHQHSVGFRAAPEVVALSHLYGEQIAAKRVPGARVNVARRSMEEQIKKTALAAAAHQSVAVVNARISEQNQRVTEAIYRATGRDVAYWQRWRRDQRDALYDHYYNYYELEKPGESKKPVYVRQSYSARIVIPLSCFAPGTEVWTQTGPVAIEKLKPGDFVLSQIPKTGELAYKPVLEVTTRKPSDMVRVQVGDETIIATRGHPFQVPGERWKMAKKLKAGMPLSTVSGAALIEAAQDVPAGEAGFQFSHNLVVADFHTYFVGKHRLLVHDNELFTRARPQAAVPTVAAR